MECVTLKCKEEISNCSNGSMKHKLRKLEVNTEMRLHGMVCTCTSQNTGTGACKRSELKNWGKVNLGHLMDDGEVSEIDVRLCLVKSVVKLAVFVKKLWQTARLQVPV